MAEVVNQVKHLKLQLTDTSKSTTLLKTLQKLQDLDVSLDILSETGIGKTVNSLRKHKEVGEVAKSLVRYWKKLVPKDSTSNLVDSDTSQTTRLKAESEEEVHPSNEKKEKNGDVLQSQGKSQETTTTTTKVSKKVDDKRPASPREQHEEENGQEDLSGSSLEGGTPQIPHNKCSIFKMEDVNKNLEDENNNSVTLKKKYKHLGHHDTVHGSKDSKCKLAPTERTHSVSDKACKDKESHKKRPNLKSTPELRVQHRLSSKAEAKYSKTLPDSASEKEDSTETLKSCLVSKSKKKNVVEKKKPSMKMKNTSENRHSNTGSIKAKTKPNNSNEADLGGSSMSFESYLSYDTNALKRKARNASKQPPKKPKTLEKGRVKSIKWPSLSESCISMNKVKDNVMDLLNTPLPEFLPDCDKLSTVDYYETKRGEKESCDDPEETHFTGQRLNKKMQVYSGNKTTFLPSMMSLFQQCIRTLQNNIDMLYDTGGVPFEILEPVLERCTPDQLLRIEECNPCYIGVSDQLWGKHCERDFRGSKLLEYESWKEMYLRLSEERENKFKRLAKTIVSAHSKKPQGRQVKMAFIHTVAKPPRDVRIQQEIYGTAGAVQPSVVRPRIQQEIYGTAGAVQPSVVRPRIQQEIYGTAGAVQPSVIRPSVKIHDHRARPNCLETPKSAPTNSGTANPQDPRKKTRVAPMMAKSLKAFKKQLGRR